MDEQASVDATASNPPLPSAPLPSVAANGVGPESSSLAERVPFRQLLREALSGTHRDYTVGPIPRAI